MKKFIKNSILFFLLIVLLLLFGLLLPNNGNRSIDYSIIKKHSILKSVRKPKVILTGGSNVLFGYNSKLIEDSINKPVINHAIHAGYGLKYILEDVLKFVQKGDTIIVSPEYSHFIENNYLGSEPLLFSLTAKPENIKLLSLSQVVQMIQYVPKFSSLRIKAFIYNSVNSKNFNKEINVYGEYAINGVGDNSTHWNLPNKTFDSYVFKGKLNSRVFTFLEKYNEIIEDKKAVMLIDFPSLCNSSYIMNKEIIKKIERELLTKKLNIINSYEDTVYKDDLFFDTPYHLNGHGVLLRTHNLIKKIKISK